MSRTARISQPPGGESSISLSWQERRHPYEQERLAPRASQTTPRRSHVDFAAPTFESSHAGDRLLSSKAHHTFSQPEPSYRRNEVHKSSQATRHPASQATRHYGGQGSMRQDMSQGDRAKPARGPASTTRRDTSTPMSARTPDPKSRSLRTQRKMEPTTQTSTRSSPQIGQQQAVSDRQRAGRQEPPCPTRARFSESENRGRCTGMENLRSRTCPGDELRAPMCNPWLDGCGSDELLPAFVPKSSRSNARQTTVLPARQKSNKCIESQYRGDNAESSARCYGQRSSGILRSQDAKYNQHSASHEKGKVKPHKNSAHLGAHPWSMGSSVSTSARGQGSVIESSPADLWETSSVDSLPLGAEWFNFMHAK